MPNNRERPVPYNLEAEQAVIGSVLLDPAALTLIDLEPREFYFEKNLTVYAAMRAIHLDGQTADMVNVITRLTEQGKLAQVGGAGYLAQLISSVPSAARVEQYADLVRRDRIRRDLIDAATRIAEIGYDSAAIDTSDLLATAQAKLRAVQSIERGEVITLRDAILEFMPRFEQYTAEHRTVWGEPTGLDIDKYLGGLQAGHLWIVAGYPGKGKTSLVLNILERVCGAGTRGIFFSLEMSREELMLRLFSNLGATDSETIRRGKLTEAQHHSILHGVGEIERAPFYINDKAQTTETIRAHVARLKDSGVDLKVCAIDYLRLLRDKGDEPQRTNNITAACKQIARDFDLTVLLVQSLNRRNNGDEEPNLQSLLQGGDYDADAVLFAHFKKDRTDDTAKIVIEKNRHGRTGDVPMIFRGGVTSWANPVLLTTPEPRRGVTLRPVPTWDDLPMPMERDFA